MMSRIDLIQQRALLVKEFEYEREQYRRTAESMSIRRKVRRGVCWYPLTVGRSYTNSLQQLVVEVFRTEDTEQEHSFEPGKPVCFLETVAPTHASPRGGADSSADVTSLPLGGTGRGAAGAVVLLVDGNRMVIALPNSDMLLQIQNATNLGVQLYFDEYTYRLMFNALDRTIAAKKGRVAELRDYIHTPHQVAPTAPHPTLPRGNREVTPAELSAPSLGEAGVGAVGAGVSSYLNPSQQQAVALVLRAKDVAVVHGPPGTGKTTTLVEAIYETLRRETQVLVCAQSNMAVDWIASKLDERGLNVLRIGNPTRVTDRMLAHTYERRFESHPLYSDLWAIRHTLKQLYENGKRGDSFHQKIARLKDRAAELEMNINEQLFASAHVVACTLTGSGNPLLVGHHWHTVFIDEAAQALEASCWIAMQRADRVVLAGDHRQLPPTLKCPEAIRGGLDHTMMQTIVERHPEAVSLLRVQYRMNDVIMQFSNQCFYDGLLESHPSVRYRGLLDWDTPMQWVESAAAPHPAPPRGREDTHTSPTTTTVIASPLGGTGEGAAGAEELALDGLSRVNRAEAELTVQVFKEYVDMLTPKRFRSERVDVGIISPYKGQVHLLRQLLRQQPWFKPLRGAVTIDTVDGFQGQERDVIILSLVRHNEAGEVGFLRDLRRMNVAITRARMKLIVIGHSPTLCHQPFYRLLYKYINNLS